VGRVDDAAETSLAVAAAAIITARWATHAAAGGSSAGHEAWAPPAANGQSNDHGRVELTEDRRGRAPVDVSGELYGLSGNDAYVTNGNGSYGGGVTDGGTGYADSHRSPGAVPPGEPKHRPPVVHDSRGMGSAAASFFAAAHVDAVPEVFHPPRIPGQRSAEGGDDFSFGSVMADMPFPEPFETEPFETPPLETQPFETQPFETQPFETQPPAPDPSGGGFSAFGTPASLPLAPDEVTGTQVPPGFERRTFGPTTGEQGGNGLSPPSAPPATSAASGFRAFSPPAFPPPDFAPADFAPSGFAPAEIPTERGLADAAASALGASGLAPDGFTPSGLPPTGIAPPEFAPPEFAPPELAPPELAPPEFAPPEFAPPEFAPPEFAPPEFAPPEFAPPEFAPPGLGDFIERDFSTGAGAGAPAFGEPGAEDFDKFASPTFGDLGAAASGFGITDEPGSLPRRPFMGVDQPQDSRVALLPRRTPQVPDVPEIALFANDPLLDPAAAPPANGSELTRIATYLRDDEDVAPAEPRPDGFDFNDVLEAVRQVRDVRDAHLRWNSGAGHTLRIEFVDGADAGEVTRAVVRLLREKMGLDAAPSRGTVLGDETTLDRPPPRGRAAVVASAPVPVRPGGGVAAAGSAARPAGVTARPGTYPLPRPSGVDSTVSRVVVDHVQVTTLGVEATVEVRLVLSRAGTPAGSAVGTSQGPAVEAYLMRLAATSAANAVDQLLTASGAPLGRCFVEHVSVVPFGVVEVAVVVLLLTHNAPGQRGHTEQLSGSAIVAGDPRHAVVRATLAALNRRLESLLS
jgi:hypothetical protein